MSSGYREPLVALIQWRTAHGAEGQTWSHAGPAVTLLFSPAPSQACRRGPDAHTQSLFTLILELTTT